MTDIIDGDKPTAEEFLQNLAAVTTALDLAVEQVINFINGKCESELWQPNFTFQSFFLYAMLHGGLQLYTTTIIWLGICEI